MFRRMSIIRRQGRACLPAYAFPIAVPLSILILHGMRQIRKLCPAQCL